MVENDKQKMEDKCKLYAIRYGGERYKKDDGG